MAAAAGLDGGLLIGADHVVALAQRLAVPDPGVQVQHRPALAANSGSRTEIQDRCCQGLRASAASHRPIVDAEALIWQRAASSRARSGPLHRDSGTLVSAGSAHASATASARSAAVNTGGRPLRGESFSPASRPAANRRRHLRTVSAHDAQLPRDRGVGQPGGRGQHDPRPQPVAERLRAPTGHEPLTRPVPHRTRQSGTGSS